VSALRILPTMSKWTVIIQITFFVVVIIIVLIMIKTRFHTTRIQREATHQSTKQGGRQGRGLLALALIRQERASY
jgi:hypothetical protein